MPHFVSVSCGDEKCRICRSPATHKVDEKIAPDDPNPVGHNFTAYVCCEHFRLIMGQAVLCPYPAS